MKLGYEFYPLNSLKSNQKCGVLLKKTQNSGNFAGIRILHSNDPLSTVHEGYNPTRDCCITAPINLHPVEALPPLVVPLPRVRRWLT